MTQVKVHLMEKNTATNYSQVTVPVLAGWTKKLFGHYAILKLFSLRSPSERDKIVAGWYERKTIRSALNGTGSKTFNLLRQCLIPVVKRQ